MGGKGKWGQEREGGRVGGEEEWGEGGGHKEWGREKKSVCRKRSSRNSFSQRKLPLLKGKYLREILAKISAFLLSQILFRTYIFPQGFKLWKQRSNKLFLSEMCRNTNQDTMKSKDPAPESTFQKYISTKMCIRDWGTILKL